MQGGADITAIRMCKSVVIEGFVSNGTTMSKGVHQVIK